MCCSPGFPVLPQHAPDATAAASTIDSAAIDFGNATPTGVVVTVADAYDWESDLKAATSEEAVALLFDRMLHDVLAGTLTLDKVIVGIVVLSERSSPCRSPVTCTPVA